MSSTVLSSSFSTAAMVDGVRSQHFCMALARAMTSLRPSSKLMAPAATKAENSPSEWPPTMSGLNCSPMYLARMTLWRKMAGCVTRVCLRSSGVPANIRSVMRKPIMSLAFSNMARHSSLPSYRFLPMPTNWAPCPGNTYAFIFVLILIYINNVKYIPFIVPLTDFHLHSLHLGVHAAVGAYFYDGVFVSDNNHA